MSNDMQWQASQLKQQLLQQTDTSPLVLLAGHLGVYQSLDNLDNGTRALVLLTAFIEKYGDVLELQRVAHQEIHS